MAKVLVTGGSGLIGKSIVKLLLEKGFEVNVLDLWEVDVEGINYIKGSVLNIDDIETAIAGCDYVIHLAAVLGVSRSTHKPVTCLDVNINGTKNILDSCLKNKIKKILFSSSSEVYGEPDEFPVTEEATLQPKSEYGISKVVGEEYLKAYKIQYGLNYSIVRFFNVYGVKQEPWWVMSKFTTNAVLGKPLLVFGDGEQIRAFCNVRDIAEGVLKALLSEKANGKIFNIGNSKEQISMKELASKVMKIAGREDEPTFIPLKESDRTKEREIYKRVPSTERAKEILDFEAKIPIDEGIKEIIDYKKANIEDVKKEAELVEETEKELTKDKE